MVIIIVRLKLRFTIVLKVVLIRLRSGVYMPRLTTGNQCSYNVPSSQFVCAHLLILTNHGRSHYTISIIVIVADDSTCKTHVYKSRSLYSGSTQRWYSGQDVINLVSARATARTPLCQVNA